MLTSSLQTNSYLRIASLSVALYDFILTLPAEWRFYRNQRSITRLSTACLLFILIRYSSILILFISNYGYFATSFTAESCQRFFLVAPVVKVIQTMVSQAILGIRTINIARQKPWVKWVVIASFTIITALEWFINLFHRDALTINGNCSAGNSGAHLSVWVYYLLSMLYDLVTLSISTVFLFKMNIRDKRFSRLPKIMLYDGLGYFIILTVSNIINIILYRMKNQAIQSIGSNPGFVVVWIMSQRILIHLREVAAKSNDGVIIARKPQSSKDLAKAMSSQDDSKIQIATNGDAELEIHVKQSVSIEYDGTDHGHDDRPTWHLRS